MSFGTRGAWKVLDLRTHTCCHRANNTGTQSRTLSGYSITPANAIVFNAELGAFGGQKPQANADLTGTFWIGVFECVGYPLGYDYTKIYTGISAEL